MVLNIAGASSLVIFILLILPILLANKSYFYGANGYAFLNKSNLSVIQGAAMILILIQIGISKMNQPDAIFRAIAHLGDIGAAVFLFFMGYQLVRTSLSKGKKVRRMMLRKIVSLLLVFYSSNVLLGLILIYMGEHISLVDTLSATVRFQFLDGTSAYFIAIILSTYLILSISSNLKFFTIMILLFSGISFIVRWPIGGFFYVLGGAVLAHYARYGFLILKKHLLNLTLITGILMMGSLILKVTILMPLIGVLGALIILMKVQFKSRLFSLISQFSVSLYTLYLPILYFVFYSSEPKSSVLLIVVIVSSLMLVIGWKVLLTVTFMPKRRYES